MKRFYLWFKQMFVTQKLIPGGFMENILSLLNSLQASIAGLQSQLSDAQAAVDQVSKEAYDKGFAEGVAFGSPDSDKIYSQAEFDAAIAPLQAQVTDLQAQVDAAAAGVEAAVAEKVAAFKADLKSKWEASQASESQSEADFASFLE